MLILLPFPSAWGIGLASGRGLGVGPALSASRCSDLRRTSCVVQGTREAANHCAKIM